MLSYGAINLWAVEKQDFGQHYRWANNDTIRRLAGAPPKPRCTAELEAWFVDVVKDPTQEVYSVKTCEARMVGWVHLFGIDSRNGCAEVGIVLDEEEWGKGFGHDALVATIRYAFEDLRLHRLQAEVLDINLPSKNLFGALGFQEEGRRRESCYTSGRFLDTVVYGLLSREFHCPPARSQAQEGPGVEAQSE